VKVKSILAISLISFIFLGIGLVLLANFYDRPRLSVDNPVIDLGSVNLGEIGPTVTALFNMTNTGRKNLVIDDVDPGCASCSVAYADRNVVPPGEEINLKVEYNAPATPGPWIKEIEVKTNDPKNDVVILRIKGFTILGCHVSPREIYVDNLPARSSSEVALKVLGSTNDKSFEVQSVCEQDDAIDIKSIQKIGTVKNRNIWQVKLVISAKSIPQWEHYLDISTSDEKYRHIKIPVKVTEKLDFEAKPSMLILSDDSSRSATAKSIKIISHSQGCLGEPQIQGPSWLEIYPGNWENGELLLKILPRNIPKQNGMIKGEISVILNNTQLYIPVIILKN